MTKVTKEQKLKALKNWLKENNIEYVENHETKSHLTIDVWIPSLYIAIHLGDDDGTFYKKTRKWCKPFFIRESETQAFVLEKIQNCCFDQMVEMQRRFEKNSNNERK